MSWVHQIKLFQMLDIESSKRLENRSRRRSYKAGEEVIRYEDNSRDVWFLVTGKARVRLKTPAGKELVVSTMSAGDVFGEMVAFDHRARSASITTIEPCEFHIMQAEEFCQIATEFPEVASALQTILISRLRATNDQVQSLAFMTNRQRLGAELLRRARPRIGHQRQWIITPPPTHQDLADCLGMVREAVTREMTTMRKMGLIESLKGGCVILEPEALKALVSE